LITQVLDQKNFLNYFNPENGEDVKEQIAIVRSELPREPCEIFEFSFIYGTGEKIFKYAEKKA
jgi:hypothetical protein